MLVMWSSWGETCAVCNKIWVSFKSLQTYFCVLPVTSHYTIHCIYYNIQTN